MVVQLGMLWSVVIFRCCLRVFYLDVLRCHTFLGSGVPARLVLVVMWMPSAGGTEPQVVRMDLKMQGRPGSSDKS